MCGCAAAIIDDAGYAVLPDLHIGDMRHAVKGDGRSTAVAVRSGWL